MIAIKDMEMPTCCAECVVSRIDNARYMICSGTSSMCTNPCCQRNDDCPLVETGICEDCVKGHKYKDIDECFCDYLQDDVDTDFYCTEFKKRGNKNE